MKTKCLDDFYKSLEVNTNGEYVKEIKNLIENNQLTIEKLTKIIEKEA